MINYQFYILKKNLLYVIFVFFVRITLCHTDADADAASECSETNNVKKKRLITHSSFSFFF